MQMGQAQLSSTEKWLEKWLREVWLREVWLEKSRLGFIAFFGLLFSIHWLEWIEKSLA
jgi:hypothetical protein